MAVFKIYFNLFLLLSSVSVFSQYSSITYNITNYNQRTNDTSQEVLVFNNFESYGIRVFHKEYKNYSELSNDLEFLTSSRFLDSLYKAVDSSIFGIDNIYEKGFHYYKDDFPTFKWKLLNNQEKVLGYECNIAETTFRGRTYKVWYTKEIPVQFGPWKFRGLPGMILKVVDNSNTFIFEAVTIELNSVKFVPEKYLKAFQNRESFNSYRDFIKIENESYLLLRQKALANLPKGINIKEIPNLRQDFLERSFEWEETKKP